MKDNLILWLRNGFYKCALKNDAVDIKKLIAYAMETFNVSKKIVMNALNQLEDAGIIEIYYFGKPTNIIWGWYLGSVREMDKALEV